MLPEVCCTSELKSRLAAKTSSALDANGAKVGEFRPYLLSPKKNLERWSCSVF